jgi:hypothetical protein
MAGILNERRHVALLAAAYGENARSMRLYLTKYPEAMPLSKQMAQVIRKKLVDVSGDPFDVAARAHKFVKRNQRDLSKPSALEKIMREEQESK